MAFFENEEGPYYYLTGRNELEKELDVSGEMFPVMTPLYQQRVVSSRDEGLIRRLCEAARENKVELLQQLVEEGANISTPFGEDTALHYACKAGSLDAVFYLESQGADMDKGTPSNPTRTPKSLLTSSNLILYLEGKPMPKEFKKL